MRGSRRGAANAARVALLEYGWDPAAIATLKHCSLPWLDGVAREVELAAAPVETVRSAGARDRLSLVGQFAAHIAFLQFAGLPAGAFDASEWRVIRKRGCDCRLVRVSARSSDADVPVLGSVQQFAEAVASPDLGVLRRSWTRAESVYAEVFRKLRGDAAADLRWLRRSAVGQVTAPGAAELRRVWSAAAAAYQVDDGSAFVALARLDDSARCVTLRGDFVMRRYAALGPLDESLVGSPADPARVAEMLVQKLAARRHVIIATPALDGLSRRVLDLLVSAGVATGVTLQGGGEHLPESRFALLSSRIAANAILRERLSREREPEGWLERFVDSPDFDRYVDEGALPADDSAFDRVEEPRRSFIAALALLGRSVSVDLASDYLRQFLFDAPLTDVVVEGVTSIAGGQLHFASEAVRDHCARHIPDASRRTLCRAAASVADPVRAALLLMEAGDTAGALERLEAFSWPAASEAVAILSLVPAAARTARLNATLAHALVDEGRYADARDVAARLDDAARELLLALCERRCGDYSHALGRVRRLDSTRFETAVLHADLLRVTGSPSEAREVLRGIATGTDEQRTRVEYELALAALDLGEDVGCAVEQDHYFAARLATYCALARGDFDQAERLASRSIDLARCVSERIDASVDRVFAAFSSGRWEDTRAIALESLAVIDQAQGDRAVAGILFTLAFLAADDAQWDMAAEHIRRLRQYYGATGDATRLAEVDLPAAHLDFCRGAYATARRTAFRLLERGGINGQLREAAALIVDEIDWMSGVEAVVRSKGNCGNRELDERHRLMSVRRGAVTVRLDGFAARLAEWEHSAGASPPRTASRSEKIRLMRSAIALKRRDVARQLAAELGAAPDEQPDPAMLHDVDFLRSAASAPYPYRADAFEGVEWTFAVRNRLGQWNQEGNTAFDANVLDRVMEQAGGDWVACSDRELLYVKGAGCWPPSSREAVSAVVHTRAENHRLRRAVEQDERLRSATTDSADGIVGESAVVRAVFALVDRIARRDVAVCITGESGTGKELVGRAIHRASARRQKPFVAVNCAALPETLIESELFGHVRGAFTGAERDRAGLIEAADGGTLFLDEIGEMPVAAQAKLLRFLQEGEFRRVGDPASRTADVRIVSATNRKLESSVEEGRFREDLYYRIRGVDVVLPPLRERGNDVLLLAEHFLAREHARHRSGPLAYSPEAAALLRGYGWPGNVRELQNTVRAAHAIAGDAREIDIEHLPERVRNVRPVRQASGSYHEAVARFRRELIEKSLLAAAGNQNRAAAMLNMSRQALAYQIRELGILVGRAVPRPRV